MTDALGHAMRYAYAGHLLTRTTFRSGLNFYFAYDGTGPPARCVHTWGDGGLFDTRLQYNTPTHTTAWDSYGHQKEYHHQRGLVIQRRDALGAVQRWRYSPTAELEHYTDPLGHTTRYEHDGRGNQTGITYPDGATVATQFNAHDLPVQGTDANGGTWQWQHDEQGHLLSGTDPTGAATTYTYDVAGRLLEVTDALGHATRLRYDEAGNLAHTAAPEGGIRSQEYDTLGRLIKLTDARGHVERRRYDRLGQLTDVLLPNGTTRRFAYDEAGNVAHAKDGTQQVGFTYTPMGQLAQRSQAGQTVQFRYDKEGNLTELTNEQGEVHRFTLDATGQVAEEVGFDGLTRRYERDLVGRVREVLRPAGRTTAYTYDKAGRIVEVTHNQAERTRYRYRPDGVLLEAATDHTLTAFERDPLGRVLTELQSGHSVHSTYNQMGLRTGLTSSLGASIGFERDALGQIRETQAGDWQSSVARDADGLELHRQLSGGLRTQWQHDALGRPVSQRIAAGGTARQRRYQWQSTDQLTQIEDSQQGTTRFVYDAWGNLAAATYADGTPELRQPDAMGNLFRSPNRTDRRYGPGGQLREDNGTRYNYDEEGNLTKKTTPDGKVWRYAWDAAGQLVNVTRPDGYAVTFTYDALGRRVSKRFRGRITKWVWDSNKPLHEWTELEVSPGAGAVKDLETWLFEEDSFVPAAKLTQQGNYSVVCDHLGTPLELYDGNGTKTWEAQFDSYGAVRQGQGKPQDCPFRYQGQYEDVETGLYYNRFRYYDPESGLYISQDPIGLGGGVTNLYTYTHNPNSWLDVFGLAPTPINAGDAGAFSTLKGIPGDDLTAHHMPQDALGHLPRPEGGALVMTHAEHSQTRTFLSRGRLTKAADANRPFMDVFVDDIRDVRNIVGKKYDAGIKQLIKYYERKGFLPKGALKLKNICP